MFAEDLNLPTVACIHFLEPSQSPNLGDVTKTGIYVAEFSAKKIRTKADLLDAIAEAFKFPEHFGKNWDALNDSLRDLQWLSAKGYVLMIRDAESLWRHSPKLAGTLVEIWLSCAESWLAEKTPFHLLFEI